MSYGHLVLRLNPGGLNEETYPGIIQTRIFRVSNLKMYGQRHG